MFKIFRERLSDCLYYNFMNILMEPGFLLLLLFFFTAFLPGPVTDAGKNLEDVRGETLCFSFQYAVQVNYDFNITRE